MPYLVSSGDQSLDQHTHESHPVKWDLPGSKSPLCFLTISKLSNPVMESLVKISVQFVTAWIGSLEHLSFYSLGLLRNYY